MEGFNLLKKAPINQKITFYAIKKRQNTNLIYNFIFITISNKSYSEILYRKIFSSIILFFRHEKFVYLKLTRKNN